MSHYHYGVGNHFVGLFKSLTLDFGVALDWGAVHESTYTGIHKVQKSLFFLITNFLLG
jgi:hypothetical protein